MGGVWERIIRIAKNIINAIGNEQVLTDEGLVTVICKVEEVLNERPLTRTSENVNDLEALMPSHILIMKSTCRT